MSDKIIPEGEYLFDFTESLNAYKADSVVRAGLKSVDFIVETENRFLFIEVKNIDNRRATDKEKAEWIEHLQDGGKEFLFHMGGKFKDTLLHNFAMENYFDKPIRYIIILQFDTFDSRQRGRLKENLHSVLPMKLKSDEYKRRVKIEKYDIIDIKEWNENTDYSRFPITLIS